MTLLPTGWISAKVADLGTWRGGGTPSKSKADFWAGTIPWVSAKDMKSFHLSDTEDHITQEAVESSSTTVVGADTVLLVTRSGILRHSLPVAITRMPAAINQDLKALSPRPDVLPEYVAWAFRAFARDILHSCSKSGTTVQSIEFDRFKEYSIPLAPLPEQQRIVDSIEEQFSRLDGAVASLGGAHVRLLQARASLLADLYALGPPVELMDLLVDLRYGTSVKCSYGGEGPPVLRIPNIQSGEVVLEDLKRATKPVDLSQYSVDAGDLLFVRTNGSRNLIGRVACVAQEGGHAFASYLIRARIDASRARPRFLTLVLSSPQVRREIEFRAATTAGQYNLNKSAIASLHVPLPTLEVQDEAIREVDRCSSVFTAMETQIRLSLSRSGALRRSILSEAFAGRLVPRDAAHRPALTADEGVGA